MGELETFVEDCYVAILGRPADDKGLKNYTQLINEGKIRKDQLQSILRSSEEYKTRMIFIRENASIADFVKSTYLDVLHRPVDAGGLAHYTCQITAGVIKKEDLVSILHQSLEYR